MDVVSLAIKMKIKHRFHIYINNLNLEIILLLEN